jgi:hypothetical protein
MEHLPEIRYVIVIPVDDDESSVTLFQGWNRGVADPGFHRMIMFLACMPHHAAEIFMSHKELLNFRKKHLPRDVRAIGEAILEKIAASFDDKITLYFCLPDQIACAKRAQAKSDNPSLIVSSSDQKGVINFHRKEEPFYSVLDDEIYRLLPKEESSKYTLRKPYNKTLEVPLAHGVTAPNLVVLQGLGFKFVAKCSGMLPIGANAFPALVSTARVVADQVFDQHEASREVVLYSPSVKATFYDFKKNSWNQVLRKISDKWKRTLIQRSLIKNTHYSSAVIDIPGKDVGNPYEDPYLGPVLSIRQAELAATTGAVALLASSKGIPSVRLPNAVNLHLTQLQQIESLARQSGTKSVNRLQRAFRQLNSALGQEIGSEIRLLLKDFHCLKVCSDVPIEWLYIDRLPLMISHELSKLPMTPGNMLLQRCASGERLNIPESILHKVLILRSFREDDPIRDTLKKCLEQASFTQKVSIKFVDVSSMADAVIELNAFDGAIVIFDCHGNHGGEEDQGWLQIGDDQVVTWHFAHVARVPPIVILSACSTAPVCGSHISVANGLLRSGALSVVGTFLPVDALRSAIFITRILKRIDLFLPAAGSLDAHYITWRTLISTFFQMSYLTDVLHHFHAEGILHEEAVGAIQLDANQRINFFREDWFDRAMHNVAVASSVPVETLMKKIVNDHPLFETMYYTQVGSPEDILIWFEKQPLESLPNL